MTVTVTDKNFGDKKVLEDVSRITGHVVNGAVQLWCEQPDNKIGIITLSEIICADIEIK